jgi:hypothetical protein
MARELLEIGAERGLKILFCEAVDALNARRGAWLPLPAEPAKCSILSHDEAETFGATSCSTDADDSALI